MTTNRTPEEIAEEIVREWYGGGELVLGDCQGLIDGIAQAIERDRAEREQVAVVPCFGDIISKLSVASHAALDRNDKSLSKYIDEIQSDIKAALQSQRHISMETLERVREALNKGLCYVNTHSRTNIYDTVSVTAADDIRQALAELEKAQSFWVLLLRKDRS